MNQGMAINTNAGEGQDPEGRGRASHDTRAFKGGTMNLILLIVVLLLVFGGLPQLSGGWHGAGYLPSGVGVVLLIVLLIVLFR
jgi:hypothetical protein